MDGYNKVILIGNLGKDAELKYSANGNAVCSFSLAVGESWKDKDGKKQQKTEWLNTVIWGRTAETLNKYLTKGKTVLVEGKITIRSWEDKDGNKHYKTEILAGIVKLLGGSGEKRDSGDYRNGEADQTPQDQQSSPPPVTEDDLPF